MLVAKSLPLPVVRDEVEATGPRALAAPALLSTCLLSAGERLLAWGVLDLSSTFVVFLLLELWAWDGSSGILNGNDDPREPLPLIWQLILSSVVRPKLTLCHQKLFCPVTT